MGLTPRSLLGLAAGVVAGGLAVAGCQGGEPAGTGEAGRAQGGEAAEAARIQALVDLPEPARCAVCHKENVHTWRTSGHGYALQPIATADVQALPGSHVSGAWPAKLDVVRGEGKLGMSFVDADGEYRTYGVTHVLGGMERQMYIAPMGPDGRPQMLPAEWGNQKQSFRQYWRPVDQLTVPPGDPGFWRTFDRAFVNDCVRCHSPRTKVTYDPDAGAYHVDWGRPRDVGITCSACHGDCDDHVESAHKQGRRARPGEKPLPTKGARAEVISCARCHSQSARVGRFPRADEEFYDALNPMLLDDPAYYYPNGRNFGESGHSLLSWELAACFRKGGLRCTDCHPPHGGGTKTERIARARASCAECHHEQQLPTPCITHPRLQPDGTGGAGCLECHMPHFAVANGHAHVTDHRIAVPDPLLTKELGIPNACTECHTNGNDWLLARMDAWGVKARPERAWTLALGKALRSPADPAAFPELRARLSDPGTPWPVSATAARLLGRGDRTPDALRVLVEAATTATHPMVRTGAAYGLGWRGEPEATAALRRLLDDERRVVRVMAAASLIFRRDKPSLPRAIAQMREVVGEVPDLIDTRLILAFGLLFAGQVDAALTEAQRCERIDAANPQVQSLLAQCRRAQEGR